MSGGGGAFGGGGHGGFVAAGRANRYSDNWMAETKATLDAELKDRGIEPMPKKCNCIPHIIITALIVTVIAMVIWELT